MIIAGDGARVSQVVSVTRADPPRLYGSRLRRCHAMRSEAAVQQDIRLNTPFVAPGSFLHRNNVGAGIVTDAYGQQRQIRYGLCNDSAQMNKQFKSSDLIGPVPTLITPQMVGYHLGVFTAIECKPEGWTQRPGDERAAAQARYHDLVRAACGYAGFATSMDDVRRIIGR